MEIRDAPNSFEQYMPANTTHSRKVEARTVAVFSSTLPNFLEAYQTGCHYQTSMTTMCQDICCCKKQFPDQDVTSDLSHDILYAIKATTDPYK